MAQRTGNRNAAGSRAVVALHGAKLAIFPKPGNRGAEHMGTPAKEGNHDDRSRAQAQILLINQSVAVKCWVEVTVR
jgi:hypothetical protein